ncbi:hypothetical protein, partial, partial [Absidia glauca]
PVAAVDPALTVLPAVSVSPSAPVLCSSFSPRPLDDSDDDDDNSDIHTFWIRHLQRHDIGKTRFGMSDTIQFSCH